MTPKKRVTRRQGDPTLGDLTHVDKVEPKKKPTKKRTAKRPPPEPVIESSEPLNHTDPANVFETPQVGMHLRPDVMHHPDPRNAPVPSLYAQTVKKMGWDPLAGDDPPWKQRLHKR